MSVNLSVICPTIRPQNWYRLYQSIKNSFSGTFELIFVGPYPDEGKWWYHDQDNNIRYIRDWGSPNRCQQIGLYNACGNTVTWAADDGEFLPNGLEDMYRLLITQPLRTVIIGKYLESSNPSPAMYQDEYYKFGFFPSLRSSNIDPNAWLFNVGLMPRALMEDFGGWNCEYETTTIAHMDLALRMQRPCNQIKVYIRPDPVFKCDHMPGTEGDHGPVHYAHINHDEPILRDWMDHPDLRSDNWKGSPPVWNRRFK